MTQETLANTRVGKIVARQPQVARVFEQHRIDYCCRGNTTLREACAQKDLDVNQIIAAIETLAHQRPAVAETDWSQATLGDLADHIVATHHRFLATELPRISELIARVVRAHGDRRPELANVATTFQGMRDELESHMAKEEQILFPAIKWIETNQSPARFPFGSLTNPIGMMEHEHDDAGRSLRRLRELTHDFEPPADACPTYRVMLESLRSLELDLHRHIHKENNILFPRAAELERVSSLV